MASFGKVVNRSDLAEDQFQLVPAGIYTAIIESDEKKQSKNKPENSYLNLKVRIVEGERKGAVIFTMLNLWNSNEVAKNIAEAELGKIMDACHKPAAADSAELHNIPVKIKVQIEPGQAGYNDKNVIKDWKAIESKQAETPEAFPNDSNDDLW